MQATRQDILDLLRRHTRATVKDIGEELGLTSTGIRQHLTVLERDGLVEAQEERGHVGRPALVYRLTSEGDALYPKRYDDLALALIEEARSTLGPQALQSLMRGVAQRFAARYERRLEHKDRQERLEEVALILEERGNVVTLSIRDEDASIGKHTCPFWNVATQNSAVCALDVQFIRQLTGGDARLTSSLLRGDDCCTFRIRPAERPSAAPRQ
ncbi:MAG TPA: winged helix-turn-helix transcriptional regulator [Dehalococcoidia bacterium]